MLDASVADESVAAPDEKVASLELLTYLLERLDPRDRLILELKELEQKSIKEISALTGWTGVNVRVRAMRAKAKLRLYWKEMLESDR